MLFSSLTFLAGFLPIVLAGTFLLRRFAGTGTVLLFLLVSSLVFYSWMFPAYLFLLTGSVLANYLLARKLSTRPGKPLLWLGIGLNLGLLGWFKYALFFTETLAVLTGHPFNLPDILLPLAISFFTFQQIAYLVDVFQGKTRPGNVLEYAFFICFFPQLIAGPIVHHKQIIPQLQLPAFARFHSQDLLAGMLLFALGLAKKVLLADSFRHGADRLFDVDALGLEPSLAEAWLGMVCYSFQIYFDFSGYSDMAVGLGRMFGIRLPINFFSPYKASSIIDFWRRWNITLSQFLRDYLYIPLGGNRHGRVMRYVNLFIVMLLGGLWHGGSWTFVVWGGLHGLYLCVNHAWRNYTRLPLPHPVAVSVTFLAVLIAWVFFRADSFSSASNILAVMSGFGTVPAISFSVFRDFFWIVPYLLAGFAVVWFVPNSIELVSRLEGNRMTWLQSRAFTISAAILAILSVFSVFSKGTYEFLYFQF
ncbi:MBOAT family O-acyltransferase [Labrenzia sp. OB1]|uniref:MBOAT family O-acyltransferase n=1 Tax=Labrenzia sp. OB1 TaxID=1561204 RepID=UPI0007B1807E|nr:MBOAT family O-acyltransferase [Labrenzia sp. OB1]KZM51821.1 hypothetical protein OA90_00455 [Labrenzia sp. OB1]